ncbi:hypothetical protein ACFL6C_07770 [Myxococcota bacterium]
MTSRCLSDNDSMTCLKPSTLVDYVITGILHLVGYTLFAFGVGALGIPILLVVATLPEIASDDEGIIWLAQFGGTLAASNVAWILVSMFFGIRDLEKAGVFTVLATVLLGLALVW